MLSLAVELPRGGGVGGQGGLDSVSEEWAAPVASSPSKQPCNRLLFHERKSVSSFKSVSVRQLLPQ